MAKLRGRQLFRCCVLFGLGMGAGGAVSINEWLLLAMLTLAAALVVTIIVWPEVS